MYREINDKLKIDELYIDVDEYSVYTKVIHLNDRNDKTAVYLHGGGIYGDSTLIERPAKWLVENNVYGKLILFDRVGFGKSSPLKEVITNEKQAQIIKQALHKIGVNNSYTILAASYGGLIGLWLAYLDNQAERIYLIASSPDLTNAKLIYRIFGKANLIKYMIKLLLFVFMGSSSDVGYTQDELYKAKSVLELKLKGLRSIQNIDRDLLDAYFMNIDSIFIKENLSFPKEIKFEIPVVQIIGSEDEFWNPEIDNDYIQNFKSFEQILIPDADHKSLVFNWKDFHKHINN